MNTDNNTDTISPAELDKLDELHALPHYDPANPFPQLDTAQNKLIIDATRPYYYHKSETKSKGNYYFQEKAHSFISLDEQNVKRMLFDIPGINRERIRKPDGTTLTNSLADYCLLYIARYKNLRHVHNLISGHRAGVNMEKRALYLNELQLITPRPGDWPTIKAILKSIFTEPGKIRDAAESAAVSLAQYNYFIAWSAHAVRTLYRWQFDPGALLALIGAPAAGKSFLLNKIIAPMLATPFPASCASYLAEGKFNSEWAPCALLTADDQGIIVKSATRRQASENLKSLLAPGPKSITGKGADTYQDLAFWRFVICANTTNLDGLILEVNGSTNDKIAALFCNKIDAPGFRNVTPEEKQALDDAITAELPAFIHYLLHVYENPTPAARYGAPVYRHPKLDEALRAGSAAMGVLDYICRVLVDSCSDMATFKDDVLTNMTAGAIRKKINNTLADANLKIKPPHGWNNIKNCLEQLAEEQPHFVSAHLSGKNLLFSINFGALRDRYE